MRCKWDKCITLVLKVPGVDNSNYCICHHGKANREYDECLENEKMLKMRIRNKETEIRGNQRELKRCQAKMKLLAKNLNLPLEGTPGRKKRII